MFVQCLVHLNCRVWFQGVVVDGTQKHSAPRSLRFLFQGKRQMPTAEPLGTILPSPHRLLLFWSLEGMRERKISESHLGTEVCWVSGKNLGEIISHAPPPFFTPPIHCWLIKALTCSLALLSLSAPQPQGLELLQFLTNPDISARVAWLQISGPATNSSSFPAGKVWLLAIWLAIEEFTNLFALQMSSTWPGPFTFPLSLQHESVLQGLESSITL